MRKVHLTRTQDVRRLLSRVINMVLNDEMEANKGNCIGQLCNIMLKAMEKSDLERRIEDLQRLLIQRDEVGGVR